jgi:hypothetical protein
LRDDHSQDRAEYGSQVIWAFAEEDRDYKSPIRVPWTFIRYPMENLGGIQELLRAKPFIRLVGVAALVRDTIGKLIDRV